MYVAARDMEEDMRNICVPAVSVLIVSLDHVPSRSDKHIKFIVLYVIVFTTVLCVLSPTTVIWLYTIRAICRAGPVWFLMSVRAPRQLP